jgi:hypothetical protein
MLGTTLGREIGLGTGDPAALHDAQPDTADNELRPGPPTKPPTPVIVGGNQPSCAEHLLSNASRTVRQSLARLLV